MRGMFCRQWLAPFFLLVCTAPAEAWAAGELECVPIAPVPIYTDKGSGAGANGSFWRPGTGYVLGDLAVSGYDRKEPVCGFVSQDPTVFADPLGFTWIWDDYDSGGNRDGTVWEFLFARNALLAKREAAAQARAKP